ncbi:MAG TPA: hypothetical protein VGS11_07305 [Candidatus Bathyarchaeia archaeon]|nr:hypothetical protein [Candidatus Bathyarchaeia archaeon]
MSSQRDFHKILATTFTTKIAIVLIVMLLTSTLFATSLIKPIRQDPTSPPKAIPALSDIASLSMFAKVTSMGYTGPETGDDHHDDNGGDVGPIQTVNSYRINQNYNQRPQDEPAVTANPSTGTVVVGANDYGIGGPVGGGVYTHIKGAAFPSPTYFPPFPLLCAGGSGSTCVFSAPPIGTGDPALVYGARYNEYYYTSIGFANDNCASGVFLYRSSNGLDWTRPVINRFLATPTATGGGIRTITYYDGGPTGQNCMTFNDKEWIAVDNTPTSLFYGRIYVTWSQFNLDPSGMFATSSPIMLAYSDDRGDTFSNPIDVTGAPGNTNCMFPAIPANTGRCVEDQFSVPVVGTDGTIYVTFINGEFSATSSRDQYLVSRVHPGSGFSVDGPFQATFPVYDQPNLDYPTQTTGGQGRSTLCNSNFRLAATEGFAIKVDGTNAANDKLYIAWADDRAHQGEFSGVTVGPRSSGYACPAGKMTDNDVFIIRSDNQGSSWTEPIQVNQDKAPGTVNNKDQFYPWVSVNQKGQVAVLYQDRRYDNTPVPNKLARATVGTSTDLVTWKETLIAQFASNLDNAFRDGAFIGDYNNDLITNDGTIYAVYTGVTPGKFDSDIFIAIFNINAS